MIKCPVIKKKKQRIILRISPFNHLSFPVLLNAWEQHNIDKDFEIIIRRHPLSLEEIQTRDVILYSFMTSLLPDIHAEITEIKKTKKEKNILIAGGGPHITGEQELSSQIGFDTLFIGAGERNFLQFAKDLLDNHPIPKQYISQDNLISDDFSDYLPISRYMNTIPPLEIMRGCWWNCRYCCTHLNNVQYRDAASIDTYLREMKKRRISRINFISPSSMEYGAAKCRLVNLDKIVELLELARSYDFRFIEYGIFPSEIRPDTITESGMALLKKFVSHKFITIGAQSGLNARLKELQRGHTVEDIEQAAAIANAYGFSAHLDFIVGYPDETQKERQATISFIQRLNKKYQIRTHLHHFIPLSGSSYAYRLPSFLSETEREQLRKLKSAGIATDGWASNEKHAIHYIQWLKIHFPDYYSQYK
jgi:B12-binding domain/radical SAM domain protein